jgi:2-amino-4-hydroxy-6-hydroxymethyldihydropteridine diphosphokinase
MYVVDQPAFYNAAISACTDLNPMQLLKLLKDTEALVGRQVRKRYGPREVDLDLISYGSLQYTYALGGQVVLELPHPRSGERRFVLQPLADLDPKTVLLGLGQIRALLDATTDQAEGITRRDDAILSI